MDLNINKLISALKKGNPLLFTGAGFSLTSRNIKNGNPPSVKQLREEIIELGEFNKDEMNDVDLADIVDFYINENKNINKLITFLRENFQIREVSHIIEKIASVNWKRCYTTNYDNSFEMARRNLGKEVVSIDINIPIDQSYNLGKECVHINGFIDTLNKSNIKESFKLSSNSYARADYFSNNPWFEYFLNDLRTASAVIFVGYSLYDEEIKKILLKENSIYKEKTFFIVPNDISRIHRTKFEQFGYVIDIGSEGFADLISENSILEEPVKHGLTYLSQYQPLENINKDSFLGDDKLRDFLLFGELEPDVFEEEMIKYPTGRNQILIRKKLIDQSIDWIINQKKHILISGTLGNGKSVILNLIKSELNHKSTWPIYTANNLFDRNEAGDYVADLDHIHKHNEYSVVFFDNLFLHKKAIQHIKNADIDNIIVVAASRSIFYEKNFEQASLNFYEINVDHLDPVDLNKFVKIIDNLGEWETKYTAENTEKKLKLLKEKYDAQISMILLGILESKNIKTKISELLDELIKNDEIKRTIYVMALLGFLDHDLNPSLIRDWSESDVIYQADFLQNEVIRKFFDVRERSQIFSKSSLICLSLIRNQDYFDIYFVKSILLKSLSKLDSRINIYNNEYERSLFNKLLRFYSIERILPSSGKEKFRHLKDYYENAKKELEWLTTHSHYWVQLAMCHMQHDSFDYAQKFLDNSYELAKKRSAMNYHTDNIDTQQARLYLEKLLKSSESESRKIISAFSSAHNLLIGRPNEIYRYRQVALYGKVYNQFFNRLSKADKEKFHNMCKEMLTEIDEYRKNNRDRISAQCQVDLQHIISDTMK